MIGFDIAENESSEVSSQSKNLGGSYMAVSGGMKNGLLSRTRFSVFLRILFGVSSSSSSSSISKGFLTSFEPKKKKVAVDRQESGISRLER